MILYHGSYLDIRKPDLKHSRDNVDFGRGFYTTPISEQAVKWCGKFTSLLAFWKSAGTSGLWGGWNSMNANPILLQKKYARVIELFAKENNISLGTALDFFIIRKYISLCGKGVRICTVWVISISQEILLQNIWLH